MKTFFRLLPLLLLFGFSHADAQQLINEAFSSSTPSGWTAGSPAPSWATSQICSGSNSLGFTATGQSVVTPLLTKPGTLSFNKKRSSNTTAWSMQVQTSSSASGPWSTVSTITSITATCAANTPAIDLSSYSNIYVRFIDNRASGAHERAIDDVVITTREPSTQSSAINFTSVLSTSFTVNWTAGNGLRRAVFMREASAGTITAPADVTSYTASTNWSSKGTQLGTSGYYCIYDGTGTSVSMTNLAASTAYYVYIYEYNSDNAGTASTRNYFLTSPANANQTTTGSGPTITTTASSYGSPLCNATSNNISVAYTISGTYNAGNDFIAELSDASGSFTSATTIGTLASTTTAGSISATIPASQAAGTAYRIRVRATDPATTGSNNGSNITINANPVINTQPANSGTCSNTATSFTIAATGTSLTYQWQGSADGLAGWTNVTNATPTGSAYSNATTATLSVTASAGYFYRAVVSSGSCSVNSDAAELTISGTAPTINTHPSNQSGLTGATGSFDFTVAAGGSPTYQWQYSANGSSGWADVANSTPAEYTYTDATTATLDVATTAAATALVSYYRCLVTEAGCTSASNNATLTLTDPLGFQLTAANTPFTLTFDATVAGVNNGQFSAPATVAASSPTTGQLNSNAWAYHATNSSAASSFGGTITTGNGQQNGGSAVSTGIYAFRVATGNYALGVQPTGSAWSGGGNFTLKLLNRTGATVTGLLITYKVYVYNDQARSTTTAFTHSADNSTYTALSAYNYSTTLAAASSPAWVVQLRQVYLTGLSVAANNYYYIRWTGIDNGGSGSRDEIAFDDISVIANPVDPSNVSGTYETAVLSGSANADATMNITGTLTMLDNGTLASNGNLVLKSSSITETARIAALGTGADITGNVTVERFMAGGSGRRGWRTMSSPVQNLTYDELVDDIFITGPGGSTNGFDLNGTNTSVLTYEESDTARGWKNINATSDTLISGKGMLVFFRGDRTQTTSLSNTSVVPNNVIIDITGPINKNSIPVNLDYSSTGDAADQGWNLVGNPYPCEINWNSVTKTGGVDAFFYVYNQSAGSYVTQSGSAQIASGQGFFVLANAAAQSITFEENDKSSGNPTAYFKTAPSDFMVEMHVDSQRYDQAWIRFEENASAQYVFKEDARKFYNPAVNLSFVTSDSQDVQQHQVDTLALEQADTFQLRISAPENTYYFSFPDLSVIEATKSVTLIDEYLHTATDLRTSSSYTFQVDSNTASSGNRFKIVFGTGNPLPVNLLDFSGKIDHGSIHIQWRTSGESNMDKYVVQRLNENVFEDRSSHRALNSKNTLQYSSNDGIAEAGRTYYYRLLQKELDGTTAYSKVIRLSASGDRETATIISPNPAGTSFHILCEGRIGHVALFDISGKYLHDVTLVQNKADVSSLEPGIYHVMITMEDGTISYQKLLVNHSSN